MKAFLLSLLLTGSACAETLVIPVQDLLFDIPQFTNSPQFNLGGALQGQWTPETPKRTDRPTQRQLEKKLINMLWNEYPDAESIRIWHGSVIIRLPNE